MCGKNLKGKSAFRENPLVSLSLIMYAYMHSSLLLAKDLKSCSKKWELGSSGNISNPFFNVLASHCVNLLGVLCVILTVQIHVKH